MSLELRRLCDAVNRQTAQTGRLRYSDEYAAGIIKSVLENLRTCPDAMRAMEPWSAFPREAIDDLINHLFPEPA